jgi:Xaa-Pro aminopeptidase
MKRRLDRLRSSLEEKALDAIFVSCPENRRYLSGFTGSAGYLLITAKDAVLITDFRYVEQAGYQAPEFQVCKIEPGKQWFSALLKETNSKRIGFESEDMSVATHQNLSDILKNDPHLETVSFSGTVGIVENLRAQKDVEEKKLIQKAIDISDEAYNIVSSSIKIGDTEILIGRKLDETMRKLGAEGPSFDTIVGFGPNGALPHHLPSDRKIREGEPIVIDMGAKYNGYCSDLTRTFVIGEPDETFVKIYDIVLGAQLTAFSTVQIGMTGSQTDSLARKVIEEAGYGANFGHGLGHGVGLAIHEYPRVGPMGNDLMESGMIFTIEPGIYLSGWGGVRIEDIVILGDSGAEFLSKARKVDYIKS